MGCHPRSRYSERKTLKIDACEVLKNIDENLDVIVKNANKISIGNDNCVLDLLNSLAYKFINKNEIKYIVALDSMCQVASGYIGEAFWDIGGILFHKNFKGYFNYLYRHRDKNNCMEKRFVDAISFEIHTAEDKKKKEQEIDNYLNEKIIQLKLSENEIEYLKKLQAQFDPSMFD